MIPNIPRASAEDARLTERFDNLCRVLAQVIDQLNLELEELGDRITAIEKEIQNGN